MKAEPPVDMMRTHRPASAGLAALIFSIKGLRQEMEEVRARCRMPTDNMAVDQGLLVLYPIKRPIPSLMRFTISMTGEPFKGRGRGENGETSRRSAGERSMGG